MGLQDLQEFIENSCSKAAINVELDKVAWRKRGGGKNRIPSNQITPLFVVLDSESCLHRLYGGSFTDWVCGGQWNQMYQFAAALANSVRQLNIEMVVFFNGSLEKERIQCWSREQMVAKGNVRNVLNHVQKKGSPPPRAWFTPPVCLDHCLRLALQDCGIRVKQSHKDHHREVMAFCRGNAFHGIIGCSADYIVFDPPRYFSSHQFKLSRDGRLITTVQYLLDEVAKQLELPQSSLPLLASLLGNQILTEEDVSDFQWRLIEPEQSGSESKISRVHLPPGGTIIPAIAKFIRELPDTDDLESITKNIFKNSRHNPDEQMKRLQQSIAYYRSASRNGGREVMRQRPQVKAKAEDESDDKGDEKEEEDQKCDDSSESSEPKAALEDSEGDLAEKMKSLDIQANGDAKNEIPSLMHTEIHHSDVATPPVPIASPEILRIAHQRHSMGLMHSCILQILTYGEIQIPITIEDDHQLPPVPAIYQPLRQHIYGILFSVGHAGPVSSRRVLVKEWWASKGKLLFTPEIAEALSFKDWPVPHLQQLWLGREPEDKNRRMRAFLSCMRCDTPSMLDQSLVPHHALIMCCVLRYLVQFPTPLLRRYEIDALLATCVSPLLHNPYLIQEMECPMLTQRGLLIASLFMRGVETAMLANDVCGEPVPIMFTAPWHYFDGRLFQLKLQIATQDGSNLVQLCEGRVDQVAKVERMRQAIMEGCNFMLAKTPFPSPPMEFPLGIPFMGKYGNMGPPPHQAGGRPGPHDWNHNRFMFPPPTPPYTQLKVAGYTVGNWAGGNIRHPMMNKGRGMWFGGGGDASNSRSFY